MRKLLFGAAVLAVMSVVSRPAWAGKLDDFSDAPSQDSSTSTSSDSSSSDDILASAIIDLFFASLFAQSTVAASGDPLGSLQANTRGNLQGQTLKEVHHNLRHNYSFALPTFRLDGIYFYDADGIHAFRVKGEGGYLMIAADVDYTRFYEGSSRLNNFATHGLFRIPLQTEFAQLDVALGYRRIWGTQVHQGFDLGIPFYLNFSRWVQMDLRYYVTFLGDKLPIQEFDAGIAGKYKWIGARAGYRYLKVKGASPIQGPELGLFVQW